MGVVAAATVFAGVARAESAEFSWPVSKGCTFLEELGKFSGTRKVIFPNYTLELKRDAHLTLSAHDGMTSLEIFDEGSDGLGHPGDYAIVSREFRGGHKLFLELRCRDGWKYTIKSKLINGGSCVSEDEFDAFRKNVFIRIPFLVGIGAPKLYASVAYGRLVDASLTGVESIELPHKVLGDYFDAIERDIPALTAGKLTLNDSLYKNSDDIRRYAAQQIHILKRQRQIIVPNSE